MLNINPQDHGEQHIGPTSAHFPHDPISEENAIRAKMAILIQKCFRSYTTRKLFLPHGHHSIYKKLSEKVDPKERAPSGKTKVYLPKERLDIVLKEASSVNAKKRFRQMCDVRLILQQQKSSHLTIPRVRLCGEFLVEERLPINTIQYHNERIYFSEPAIFDDAVREMTRLFSRIDLRDLVDSSLFTPFAHNTLR